MLVALPSEASQNPPSSVGLAIEESNGDPFEVEEHLYPVARDGTPIAEPGEAAADVDAVDARRQRVVGHR